MWFDGRRSLLSDHAACGSSWFARAWKHAAEKNVLPGWRLMYWCRPAPLIAFVVARASMLPLPNVYNVKEVHACMWSITKVAFFLEVLIMYFRRCKPGREGDCISLERLESYSSLSTDGPSFSRWSKILLSFQITRCFNFSRICIVKIIYLEKTKHLII